MVRSFVFTCCVAAIFTSSSFSQSQSPNRTGVQPLGAYWGTSGESIDLLSGNVNYSIPLIHAQSRGWNLALGLTYKSQNFRYDGTIDTPWPRTSAMASVGGSSSDR